MAKKPLEPKKEFVEIEKGFRFIKLEPEVLKIISVGDKELDKNGQVIGEIIGLGQSTVYKYGFDIGQGQTIVKEDARLKEIRTKLKLKAEVRQNSLYYKDEEIKIGLPLKFETNKYSVAAIYFEEEERVIDFGWR